MKASSPGPGGFRLALLLSSGSQMTFRKRRRVTVTSSSSTTAMAIRTGTSDGGASLASRSRPFFEIRINNHRDLFNHGTAGFRDGEQVILASLQRDRSPDVGRQDV